MYINKVILIGLIINDPVVKKINNLNILIINLKTSNEYELNILKKEENWHRLVFYNEIIKNNFNDFKKNKILFIIGKINTRKWKENNEKINYITEIIVENFKISNYYKSYNNFNSKDYNYNESYNLNNNNFNKKTKKNLIENIEIYDNNYNTDTDFEF